MPWPEARLAAVAAVLRVTTEPELLFIKRADVKHDPWSGHIAFPGGRQEPADVSLEATARRETLEELSLDLARGRVLGRLDDLAPRSRLLPPIIVRPFVAVVPSDVEFVLSREVASTFWVPLSHIRGEAAQTEYVVSLNGNEARFPAFSVRAFSGGVLSRRDVSAAAGGEGQGAASPGDEVVWGLTERIVRQLLSLFDE